MNGDESAFRAMIRRVLGHDGAAPDAAPAPADALSYEDALQRLHAMAAAPTGQARFPCVRHGTEAGVVTLFRRYGTDSEVVVESFLGRAWHRLASPEDEARFGHPVAEALEGALARENAIEIAVLEVDWVPFLCQTCGTVYCGACWTVPALSEPEWPLEPIQIRGTCPRGHEQIMVGRSLET